MGGSAEGQLPLPNEDAALMDSYEETDLKGSMLGWVDASKGHGVIYSKKEVYVHPSSSPKDQISGYFSVVNSEAGLSIHWTPRDMVSPLHITSQPTRDEQSPMKREGSAPRITGTQGSLPLRRSSLIEGPMEVAQKYKIRIQANEIHSLKKYIPSIGYSYLIINTRDGVSQVPFYFHEGGLKEFLTVMDGFVQMTKSSEDPNVILVNDQSNKLARTLSKLSMSDVAEPPQPSRPSFLSDPAFSLLGNFAKVTQAAREFSSIFDPKQGGSRSVTEDRKKLLLDYDNFRKAKAQAPQNVLDQSQQTKTDLGTFEVLSSENSHPVEEVERKEPLSVDRWFAHFDQEGRIKDIETLKKEIFLGGVAPDIRADVWKYLLNFYPFDSTEAEREYILSQRREEYQVLKSQWKSITPAQEQYFSKFKKRKNQIEKDVERTDRTLPFYQSDDSPNLVMLHDILLTYTFFNFDLGYVQGMNDLLSPILLIMENEADAFWCFTGYMETMRHNFDKDQHGMHKLLTTLRKILQVLDPQLYSYFESKDSLNLFFCFRWLLINFKRELPLNDIMKLWEVLWACPLTSQFHLFISVAILEQQKGQIMARDMQFDDILKLINDLSLKIDLDYCLKEAEILYYKFQKFASADLKQLVL